MKTKRLLLLAVLSIVLPFSCYKDGKEDREKKIGPIIAQIEKINGRVKIEYNGYINPGMKCTLIENINYETSDRYAQCHSLFQGKGNEGKSGEETWIISDLYYYVSTTNIKNDLLLKYLIKNRSRFYNKDAPKLTIPTIIENTVLYYPVRINDHIYEWISGQYWVTLMLNGSTLPPEMLKDFLTKFPPTVTFSEADFNLQAALKGFVRYKFVRIREIEQKRDWFSRHIYRWKEYLNMSNQCWQEQMVRCYVGLTAPNPGPRCPIAFIDDQEERMVAYAKLEIEAEKMPVIVEKINFADNMMGRCRKDPNEMYDIGDHVGFPKILIKGLVRTFTPNN